MKRILVAGRVLGTMVLLASGAANAWAHDGGHGGTCTRDAECGACGWICSAARGDLCIPAFEGEIGSCGVDADCACPGQTCAAGHCTPLAQTECRCDSDCPSGRHCNQFVFACQTGACNTDYATQYNNGCQWLYSPPPECNDDFECGVSVTGAICVPNDGGQPPLSFCQWPTRADIAWCRDTLDAGRPVDLGPDAGGDGGSPTGDGDGGSYLSSSGCTCGSSASPLPLGALVSLLALYPARRRRDRHR